MLLIIYNIYVDAILFIWKNIFILLPHVFYEILKLLLNAWLTGNSLPERLIRVFAPLLIFGFFEMLVIVIVYKKMGIIVYEESIWQTFYRFSGSVLLLTVYTGFIFLFCIIVLAIAILLMNLHEIGGLMAIVLGFMLIANYPISLRHLIYHNNIMVIDSIKAGFKQLYKNFFFYLFVVLIGILMSVFPSLLLPSTWLVIPILPIAEFTGSLYINDVNWAAFILNSVFATLTSIALTYAFISKNHKTKHVS